MSLSPPGTTAHKMWTSCVRRKMPRSDYPKSLVRRGARAYKSCCRRTMADRPKETSAADGRAGKPVKPAGSDDPGGDESRRARHASDRDRRSRRDARGPLNLIHSAGLVAFCCPRPSLPGTDTANPPGIRPPEVGGVGSQGGWGGDSRQCRRDLAEAFVVGRPLGARLCEL